MPKVSVILATYNRAYILESAIRSVLDQAYKDFELIIVDDGSTDDTEKLVKHIGDARIVYVRHEKNQGLAVSRNTGIRHAQGEYLAFQDSDDIWVAEKLERQVTLLNNAPQRVGVVYGLLEKTLKDGLVTIVPSDEVRVREGNIFKEILERNFITMQVALVRAEYVHEVGLFDPELNWLEDWDFWIRFTHKYEAVHDPVIYVRARILGDSLTSNRARRLDARARTYDKHRKLFCTDRTIRLKVLKRLIQGFLYAEMSSRARGYAYELVNIAPARGIIYIIMSIFPKSVWKNVARKGSTFLQ